MQIISDQAGSGSTTLCSIYYIGTVTSSKKYLSLPHPTPTAAGYNLIWQKKFIQRKCNGIRKRGRTMVKCKRVKYMQSRIKYMQKEVKYRQKGYFLSGKGDVVSGPKPTPGMKWFINGRLPALEAGACSGRRRTPPARWVQCRRWTNRRQCRLPVTFIIQQSQPTSLHPPGITPAFGLAVGNLCILRSMEAVRKFIS
jgi:hypothetical protein